MQTTHDQTTAPPAAAAPPKRTAASLACQAGALYRKNAVYQRRAVCSNVCLLSAPLLFCCVLLAIQLTVNRLILVGPDFECGCQCTSCCYNGDRNNCTSGTSGPCPYECFERNSSACGIEWSTPRQSIFCAIPHPASWPAVLQTPQPSERAAPYRPKAAILVTGQNPSLTKTLSQHLVPKPRVTLEDLLATSTYQQGFADDVGSKAKTAVAAELLSLLGLRRLGTSSRIAVTVYLETAVAGSNASLYALWPNGSCAAMGLQGKVNTSLSTLLDAMINASNSADDALTLRELLEANAGDLLSGGSSSTTNSSEGSGMQSLMRPGGIRVNCTDVVLSQQRDTLALQTALYCGYAQARCNGTTATNAYAAAFDWADSSVVTNSVGNKSRTNGRGTSKGSMLGSGLNQGLRYSPDIYFNDTYGVPGQAPVVYQRIPAVVNMAINSWVKTTFGPEFSAELLGVMETPKAANKVQVDFGALLGPLLFTWVIQLLLPVMLVQLVYEKEKGLRMMMRMHGLGDGAYWLVMYSWFLLLYVVYMVLFVLVGSLMGLSMLRKNSYVIQFVFYFLFGNNMIASAFLLSCFFASSATAAAAAYMLVFGTGLVGSLLLSQQVTSGAWYTTLLQLVPSFSLYRGLWEMGEYAFLAVYRNSFGMSLQSLTDPGNGMTTVWAILAAEWVVFMAAAWYAEKVLATGTGGSKRRICFCFEGLWSCIWQQKQTRTRSAVQEDEMPQQVLPVAVPMAVAKAVKRQQQQQQFDTQQEQPDSICIPIAAAAAADGNSAEPHASAGNKEAAAAAPVEEPSDVAAERSRVQQLQQYSSHPIVVRDLQKTYPGQDGQPAKVAVSSLNLAIKQGECFGLLGPNGAGKSTSIHMMVGLLQPTGGTALLGGYDITDELSNVYNIMGVCPQDDRLWESLTGKEHLEFYGRLKGLKRPSLDAAVESSLRAVNLWSSSSSSSKRPAQQLQQVRQYSGGMKRRLSVAVSFVGDPLVVFLDEPSTGLDPASRRSLWDVVRSNKAGRGVLLTTHSMEEAQVLCDRLGIFVDGRLVCIGTPQDITARFGGFLVFTVTVPPAQVEAAKQFVQQQLSANARLTYSVGGTLKYELPTSEVSLSQVFCAMAAVQPDDEGDNDDSTAAAAAEGVAFRGVTDIAGSIKSNQHAPSSQQQQQAQQQQQQQQHMLSQPQRQQQQQQQNLCVLDWGVAHATLEEVFIKLAKHVGAKAGN